MSDLGKNAGKAAGSAVSGVVNLARSAAQSTKRLSRIAKLNMNISDEKKTIKRLYTEIGRLYYEARRDDPDGFFVQLVQEIDVSMEALSSMEAELQTLKDEKKPVAAPNEPDIEVEIEEEAEEPAPAEPAPDEPAEAPAEDAEAPAEADEEEAAEEAEEPEEPAACEPLPAEPAGE